MSGIADLTGQRFGRLTVLKKIGVRNAGQRGSISVWLCKCDCGNEKEVLRNSLVSGNTKSCGCLARETKKTMHIKHGAAKTRLWKIWCGIRERCNNPNNQNYTYYGSRGIRVCDEWSDKENGFINFHNWAMTNGYTNELTIDRINTNGNYEPSNCRWATRKEQTRNRNITIKIPLSEIAEIEGISYQQAYDKFVRNRSVRGKKPEPCILRGIEPASDSRPCIGYQKSKEDDEPCEMCKGCRACNGEELE